MKKVHFWVCHTIPFPYQHSMSGTCYTIDLTYAYMFQKFTHVSLWAHPDIWQNIVITDSGNGLSPVRRKSIIEIDADMWWLGTLWKKFCDISYKSLIFMSNLCICECHLQNVGHFLLHLGVVNVAADPTPRDSVLVWVMSASTRQYKMVCNHTSTQRWQHLLK